MTGSEPIAAACAPLHRLLTRGPARVVLDGGALRLEGRAGRAEAEWPLGAIDAIEARRAWPWHRLEVRTADGARRAVGGLGRREAERVAAAARAEAARRAEALAPRLEALGGRLLLLLAGERYARRSGADPLREAIADAAAHCGGALARAGLPPPAREALDRLAPLADASAFEAAREAANDRFATARAPAAHEAARGALRDPLTDEQAEAVATDEDATLVLAGAGTGKTAVVVGKVAHLVRNEGAPPGEILVLAFNREAASEIRERLPDDLAGVAVFTFHAFGRRVIAEAEDAAPTVSRLAADEQALGLAIEGMIGEEAAAFVASHGAPFRSPSDARSPFDFGTLDEYLRYVRSAELRTLSGDLVKSFEELEIANFLTSHGVEFRYEQPYEAPTATPEYGQYRPDFYLPERGVYVEHFALDERGRPPAGWPRYAEGVEWKRGIHERQGTTLVETHSWQHRRGVLLPELRAALEAEGVAFGRRLDAGALLERLADWVISWLARLLRTFLHHARTSGVAADELRARASGQSRNEDFLDVFERVRERYERMLADEGALDFHDLIHRAAAHLREGRWTSPYRYVLVDEFQDISAGRMALLEALRRPGVAYFLVGDDWQSINRFAGSDVGLVRNCGGRLGHVRERTLSSTFRFADGVLGPSTAFVQRNPQQTRRPLRAARREADDGIAVVADGDPAHGLRRALRDIGERAGEAGLGAPSVLVLGRYGRSRGALPPPAGAAPLRVEFSTVHRAKGREADYAVVLDLKDDPHGFPAQIEDDPLLEMVLPPDGEAYPHAEERRLFYVAMTRARRGCYLVADRDLPSPFVAELRRGPGAPRLLAAAADGDSPACPRCLGGRLMPSQSGLNLRCSNHPLCRHLAPRCACGEGYALASAGGACTSPSCGRRAAACPACGLGVLVEREGRYGRFLGCTEYRADPPCRHTEPHPPRSARMGA